MTALPEPATGRIRELDGVRGLAIFLVLVWHYLLCQVQAPPPLFRFLMMTWSGVDLFFVLSGFLIGGILLDHRHAANYFSVFYRRRICRIFPIYYLWLLLFVLLVPFRGSLGLGGAEAWLFNRAMPLWSYATFTQNFLQARAGIFGANWLAVTWSLAIEEQFYLVLPLIVRFVPDRLLPFLLAPFIVIAPLVRTVLYGPSAAWYSLLICKSDALVLGVLCAWFLRQPRSSERMTSAAPLLRIVLFACGGFVLLAQYAPETKTLTILTPTLLALAYTALILIAAALPASPIARLMRVRWLAWLGMISYGTYILHEPVLGLVYGVMRHDWPHFVTMRDLVVPAVALVVTLAVAAASYRWFERPILEYGRRWGYVKSSRPAAAPSAAPAAVPPSPAPPLP
jgi:peptidoglycan/LPS O-acetylase OafA/YrhL